MNGLKAIQDRILAEARETAEQIAAQADVRIAEIKAAADAEAGLLLEAARKSADIQVEAVRNRARSLMTMDSRKSALQARQAMIDQAIAKAGDMIVQMTDPEKIAFYQHLLRQTGAVEGEIVLAAADRHLASQLIAGFSDRLKIADEAGAFSSGLILRRGRIEDNMTLDLLIANRRQELVQAAAAVLFDPAAAT